MPHDPTCNVLEEELSALVDGELAASRESELRVHVTTCARCAERVAAFERAGALLSALPQRPVPADLRARLQARIDAGEGTAPAPRDRVRSAPPARRRWLGSPAFAAAAALAAAVALYWALAPADQARPGSDIELPPLAYEDPPPIPEVAPAPTPGPPELDPAPELPSVPEPVAPQIAEATPEPVAPQLAETSPAPASPPSVPDLEFDPVPADEIAVALELETIEDFDVIANLELLEALVALGEGTG